MISVKTAHPNSISYELGKNGFVHNIVVDHRLGSGRMGLRLFTGSNFGRYNFAFLAGGGAYFLAGRNRDHLELGADLAYFKHDIISDDQVGIGLVYPDRGLSAFYPSANIGYRHTGRSLLFRVGFAPGFVQDSFIPGAYLGFGFVLKGN